MTSSLDVDRKPAALISRQRIQGFFAMLSLPVAVIVGWVLLPSIALTQTGDSQEQEIQVLVETRGDELVIAVNHLAKPADASIEVYVAGVNIDKTPPILGSPSVTQGSLVFKPRFPLQAGTKYQVQVQVAPDLKPDSFNVEVPGVEKKKTIVQGFYPSSDQIPENTLRFYVHFSAPMQKGEIYQYVQIREQDGKEVEIPFLEIEQEFWSRDARRLTLLLDPGRIKRGLKPREEMGPILVAGKSYELVIKGTWPDSNGQQLGTDFVKRFRAVENDDQQPDPNQWRVVAPTAGTSTPLVISFAGSIDHAMLFRAINVVDSNRKPVEGVVVVANHETQWSFRPSQPWPAGKYKIVVNRDLEDNSGNTIRAKFDVDMFDKTESEESVGYAELPFVIAK